MKLAVDKIKNWILVSGAVRSGTTFTGRVLSLPLEVDYLHEPYNQLCSNSGNEDSLPYVGPRIDTPRMQSYHDFTKRIFDYDITLPNYIPKNDPRFKQISKRFLGSRGPFYLRLAKVNIFHKAAVIKDPSALFLTEYLYNYFQVKPVILIKHPISFVVSLHRKNWWPTPQEFTCQHDLIQDFFFDEPGYLEQKWSSPLEAAAAYWRVIYKVIFAQSKKCKDLQIIKHETMCQEPISVFNQLYHALGLPWSSSVERKIIAMTQGTGINEGTAGKIHSLRRNSSKIYEDSIKYLDLEERRAIFEIVQDIALQIYPRNSFAID